LFWARQSKYPLRGLNLREFSILLLLVALLVGLGVYPQPVLDVSGMTGTLLQPDSALAVTGQP
jgi:hypothetical protein